MGENISRFGIHFLTARAGNWIWDTEMIRQSLIRLAMETLHKTCVQNRKLMQILFRSYPPRFWIKFISHLPTPNRLTCWAHEKAAARMGESTSPPTSSPRACPPRPPPHTYASQRPPTCQSSGRCPTHSTICSSARRLHPPLSWNVINKTIWLRKICYHSTHRFWQLISMDFWVGNEMIG